MPKRLLSSLSMFIALLGIEAIASFVSIAHARSPQACSTIESYGGGTDVPDNLPAWNTFVTENTGKGACLRFGAGTYSFSGRLAFTVAANTRFVLRGEGADVTQLLFPHAGGVKVTLASPYASFSFQDFSALTGLVDQDAALSFVGQGNGLGDAPDDVTRVVLRGADGYQQTDLWRTGISIRDVTNLTIASGGSFGARGVATGTGLSYEGVNSSGYATQLNIENYGIYSYRTGIHLGSYWQGVQMVNSTITACKTGIRVPAGQSGTLSGLFVLNGNISCDVGDVILESPVNGLQLVSNLLQANTAGNRIIALGQTSNTIIEGNILFGNGGTIIEIANSLPGSYAKIESNLLIGPSVGISLASTTSNVQVRNNSILATNGALTNAGTKNVITGNVGYNPVGAAAMTPTASPWTYTASGSPETLYIAATGGIVSVTQNGVSLLPSIVLAGQSLSIPVNPNDVLVITYLGKITARRMIN